MYHLDKESGNQHLESCALLPGVKQGQQQQTHLLRGCQLTIVLARDKEMVSSCVLHYRILLVSIEYFDVSKMNTDDRQIFI